MKRVFCFVLLCAVLMMVLGCTTTNVNTNIVPYAYTNNISTKFTILGEVRYESTFDRTGYNELLKAARSLYPDCDYVIDVMIDQKTVTTTKNTMLFFRQLQSVETVSTHIMRGTAIKYIR